MSRRRERSEHGEGVWGRGRAGLRLVGGRRIHNIDSRWAFTIINSYMDLHVFSCVSSDGKGEGPVGSECGTFLSLAQSIVGGGYGGRVEAWFFRDSRLRMTGSAGTAEGSLSVRKRET